MDNLTLAVDTLSDMTEVIGQAMYLLSVKNTKDARTLVNKVDELKTEIDKLCKDGNDEMLVEIAKSANDYYLTLLTSFTKASHFIDV